MIRFLFVISLLIPTYSQGQPCEAIFSARPLFVIVPPGIMTKWVFQTIDKNEEGLVQSGFALAVGHWIKVAEDSTVPVALDHIKNHLSHLKAAYGVTLLMPENLSAREWLEAFAYEIDTALEMNGSYISRLRPLFR